MILLGEAIRNSSELHGTHSVRLVAAQADTPTNSNRRKAVILGLGGDDRGAADPSDARVTASVLAAATGRWRSGPVGLASSRTISARLERGGFSARTSARSRSPIESLAQARRARCPGSPEFMREHPLRRRLASARAFAFASRTCARLCVTTTTSGLDGSGLSRRPAERTGGRLASRQNRRDCRCLPMP